MWCSKQFLDIVVLFYNSKFLSLYPLGTSSRDSLLSWIRHLEATNPNLANIPILFTQASPIGDVMTVEPKDGDIETKT